MGNNLASASSSWVPAETPSHSEPLRTPSVDPDDVHFAWWQRPSAHPERAPRPRQGLCGPGRYRRIPYASRRPARPPGCASELEDWNNRRLPAGPRWAHRVLVVPGRLAVDRELETLAPRILDDVSFPVNDPDSARPPDAYQEDRPLTVDSIRSSSGEVNSLHGSNDLAAEPADEVNRPVIRHRGPNSGAKHDVLVEYVGGRVEDVDPVPAAAPRAYSVPVTVTDQVLGLVLVLVAREAEVARQHSMDIKRPGVGSPLPHRDREARARRDLRRKRGNPSRRTSSGGNTSQGIVLFNRMSLERAVQPVVAPGHDGVEAALPFLSA